VSLVDLNVPIFDTYEGESEGLPPPHLRRVPKGPVRSSLAQINIALARAKKAASGVRRTQCTKPTRLTARVDCDGALLHVGDCVTSRRGKHYGVVRAYGGGGGRVMIRHGDGCCGRMTCSPPSAWKKVRP